MSKEKINKASKKAMVKKTKTNTDSPKPNTDKKTLKADTANQKVVKKKKPVKSKTKAKKSPIKPEVIKKPIQPKHYDGSTALPDKRREQFCREFIISLNGTQAVIKAKYSKNGAAVQATRLLTDVNIQRRIAFLKTASVERVSNEEELEIKADWVLSEMARLARFRPEDFAAIDKDGKFTYVIDADNIHKLRGITGLKVKELKAMTIVEAGVEIGREVVEVEFKSEKKGALDSLMKHLGLLTEKVEIEGLDDLVSLLQKGRERVANYKKAKKTDEQDD